MSDWSAEQTVKVAPARATATVRTTQAAATRPAEQSMVAASNVEDASAQRPVMPLPPERAISAETERLREDLLALAREAEREGEAKPALKPARSSHEARAATAKMPAKTISAYTAATNADASRAATDEVLTIADLPPETRTALLPLTVNAHAYAEDAAKRMIIINMRRYREGDRMREGATVEAITPRGAVLVYEQQRFQLPVR